MKNNIFYKKEGVSIKYPTEITSSYWVGLYVTDTSKNHRYQEGIIGYYLQHYHLYSPEHTYSYQGIYRKPHLRFGELIQIKYRK